MTRRPLFKNLSEEDFKFLVDNVVYSQFGDTLETSPNTLEKLYKVVDGFDKAWMLSCSKSIKQHNTQIRDLFWKCITEVVNPYTEHTIDSYIKERLNRQISTAYHYLHVLSRHPEQVNVQHIENCIEDLSYLSKSRGGEPLWTCSWIMTDMLQYYLNDSPTWDSFFGNVKNIERVHYFLAKSKFGNTDEGFTEEQRNTVLAMVYGKIGDMILEIIPEFTR